MCRKMMCLISSVLVLGTAGNASADLVGHWTFNEGSGTIAYDSSGNDIDGTFGGDPQWVAGKIGSALEFDGDGDSVNFGTPTDLAIDDAISITAWVYPGTVDGWRCIVDKSDGGSTGYTFGVLDGGLWFTSMPGYVDHFSTNAIIEAGTWQYVAVTYLPGGDAACLFYVNGVETDRLDSSALVTAGSGTFLIGNDVWDELFDGVIDEVRVYNHILTEPEILAAMEGGEGYPYALGPNPPDGAFMKTHG